MRRWSLNTRPASLRQGIVCHSSRGPWAWLMTFPLSLRTLASSIPAPLWAYPAHDTAALASGEIPAASRWRVHVRLLRLESVRGLSKSLCDMWRSLEGATVRRMPYGWMRHGSCAMPLRLGLICHCPGSLVLFGPSFPGLEDRVQPGETGDGFRRVNRTSRAFPLGSFASWLLSVRLGRCRPVTPAGGLVHGHRGDGALFPPRGRALPPHVKQLRRFCVRHIPVCNSFTYVSRQLVAQSRTTPKSGTAPCGDASLARCAPDPRPSPLHLCLV